MASLDGFIECVRAVRSQPRFQFLRLGREKMNRQSVTATCRLGEVVGFGRQAAGVQAEDVDGQIVPGNQVRQDHAFGAESVGERSRCMPLFDLLKQRQGVRQTGSVRRRAWHR